MAKSVRPTIGIVTEGEGEVRGLPKLYSQLSNIAKVTLLNPMHVVVDPQAPIPLLCKRAATKINFAVTRGADIVILVLDTETLQVDPAKRSSQISSGLAKLGHGSVRVAFKHTCFENWLIADPSSFAKQVKLFPNSKVVNYPPGRADNVEAEDLISRALGRDQSYSKSRHPEKILAKSQVSQMVLNSVSFEQFVRLMEEG